MPAPTLAERALQVSQRAELIILARLGGPRPLVAQTGKMREGPWDPVREHVTHVRSAVAAHLAQTAGLVDELAGEG